MRLLIISFIILFFVPFINAQCDDLTLKQEVEMTENIAIVQGLSIKGDSVFVEVIKKWKGDSIGKYLQFKLENVLSENYRIDTGKTYILFWYNGISVDPCSRSSEFKYAHFEYELNALFEDYKVENVYKYDSIQYNKSNIFQSDTLIYDNGKGNYAFYHVEENELKSFSDLPKPLSRFKQRKFYVIDENIETTKKKYDVVFAVIVSNEKPEITTDFKKKALQSLFK